MANIKAYADLRVRVRTYDKDGEKKSVYQTIGTLYASPHFSNMSIRIDTLPINQEWDGQVYVSPREPKEESKEVKF